MKMADGSGRTAVFVLRTYFLRPERAGVALICLSLKGSSHGRDVTKKASASVFLYNQEAKKSKEVRKPVSAYVVL